jgi:hypothetical protein
MCYANKQDTAFFHIQLLSAVVDSSQYPLVKLIIDHHVTKQEYLALFQLLEKLNAVYERQKEEGLLDYTSLLVHFAGMLTEKLDPNETMYALKKEGHYPSLMNVFIQLVETDKEAGVRR